MSTAIKISEILVNKARTHARVLHRSVAGQVEYWATIGQIAEENPDLPFSFIRDILLGLEEIHSGESEPYIFGQHKHKKRKST